MPDPKIKVSLYFPKDLFRKFEKIRSERENQVGMSISKNELALKLIADAIDDLNKGETGIGESKPEYNVSGRELSNIWKKIDSMDNDISQLKKESRNRK